MLDCDNIEDGWYVVKCISDGNMEVIAIENNEVYTVWHIEGIMRLSDFIFIRKVNLND